MLFLKKCKKGQKFLDKTTHQNSDIHIVEKVKIVLLLQNAST